MSVIEHVDRRCVLHLILALAGTCAGTAIRAEDKPAPAASGEPRRAVFLDIDRILVTVFRGGEIDRHEMLLMKLELAEDTAISKVQEAMPRLRDAFIKSWNTLGARPDAAAKGLDIAAGRQRMLAACDQIAGPGLVRNVLIVGQSSRKVQGARGR
jgi:hypothetical protein